MHILSVTDLQQVAEQAANRAGNTAVSMQNEALNITQKGYRDFVSEADFASQKVIFDFISKRFPDHEFLSEEADFSQSYSSPVLWVIDPIDGTTNYIRGQPQFTISIAGAVAGHKDTATQNPTSMDIRNSSIPNQQASIQGYEVAAGVIFDPHQDELFSAAVETGSYLNRSRIQVSNVETMDKAIVGFDWSRDYHQRQNLLAIVNNIVHEVHTLRAIGSAAQALAWVACGRLDVYVNLGVGPWDVAAAKVIIEQAGGRVTNVNGDPWELWHGDCIACSPALHSQVQALMS